MGAEIQSTFSSSSCVPWLWDAAQKTGDVFYFIFPERTPYVLEGICMRTWWKYPYISKRQIKSVMDCALVYSKYKYVQPGGSATGKCTGKVQLVCCISALFNLTQNPFFLNFILFFNFTILYWFCHISKWICHRYGMEREEGGGFRMGNTCIPNTKFLSVMTSLVLHWLRLHSQRRGTRFDPRSGN